jgi:hypothetical protein
MLAIAQQSAKVALLDHGLINRKEAAAVVKYLTCSHRIKHVSVEFIQDALTANIGRYDLEALASIGES